MVSTPPPVEDPPITAGRTAADELWGAPMVSLEGVSKSFGEHLVVNDLSFEVRGGQIFGLIGPSGCGKTTLVKMLVGLVSPTSGRAAVRGVDPAKFTARERAGIGYAPQGFFLYPTLTVQENAKFVASLYGIGFLQRKRRIREVLTFLEIWDARKRLAKNISGGMQRRLSIACALFHKPGLVFVDEPTSGLDPILRAKVWDYLRQLRNEGSTVFVTTQHIDEAEYCDQVGILNGGSLIAVGTPQEIRRSALGGEVIAVEGGTYTREDVVALWELPEVKKVDWDGRDKLRLMVDDAATATPAVTEVLHRRGTQFTALMPYLPSFDEVFIELVQRP
ncbi:MAG: ABC transporter ATP-binding protein [Tepidiformaceae bacterium]